METILKLILGFAFIIFVAYLGYQIEEQASSREYLRLRDNLENVSAGNEIIAKKNELLRIKIESLREDPRAMERKVRDELGLVRPDEVVIFFRTPEGKMAEWGNAGQRLVVNSAPELPDDENESDGMRIEDVFAEPSLGTEDDMPENAREAEKPADDAQPETPPADATGSAIPAL